MSTTFNFGLAIRKDDHIHNKRRFRRVESEEEGGGAVSETISRVMVVDLTN